jgi:repressor LexA
MNLTPRQKEIFDFIRTFIKERGYPPSVREIGKHFQIYPRAVFDHLKALGRKGYVKRRESVSRGLELLAYPGTQSQGLHQKQATSPLTREIPILGRIAAGKPALAVENIEGTLSLPLEWTKEGETFLLKISGESMSPYILPGDFVMVRSQPSAENGDIVAILIGEEATVKRFFKKEGRIELKPDNERWETIRIDEGSEGVTLLGKVTGVFRKC